MLNDEKSINYRVLFQALENYKELKEMVSPGSHESKILKLDMEMIEADDKA